jgi:hypothetical protein
MVMRTFLFSMLVGVLVTLPPAALASPPDQTWIPGLYDNADYDDAVLAVTGSIAALELPPLPDDQFGRSVVAFVSLIDEQRQATPTPSPHCPRSPPTS